MQKKARQATQKQTVAERKPRKHRNQMSAGEIRAIEYFVRSLLLQAPPNSHWIDRATERLLTFSDAADALQKGQVIEVNLSPEGPRALFRDDRGICAVVALKTGDIITAYYNHPRDTHRSLDYGQYRWSVDVVKLLEELANAQ